METPEFLAIGDIVTDAFIRLKDAEVKDCVNHERQELCLSFGDKVPYESVEVLPAVGNASNAAVAAARLGIKTTFLAHVGNDEDGKRCLESLTKDKVDTSLMGIHDGLKTNYHYVLWYGVERTILIKHTQFPYAIPPTLPVPKMIYLSSLGENSAQYHHEIAEFVIKNPETKLVFQPGTFQIKLGTTELKDLYLHTYAFFCNVEEAERILEVTTKDIKELMKGIHALGPKLVFITDGINGAYGSDGTAIWFMPIYPHDPYERTGAGDAFSSTVSVALLLGLSIQDAIKWGPVNSMSVTQFVGAQKGLLDKDQLQQLLDEAPVEYQPKLLS